MEQRTDRVDAERGSGPWCQLRGRRLAVVIAVQNMLLAVCLVITLHVYWKLMDQESAAVDNVYIHFGTISSIIKNGALHFDHTNSNNMMHLIGEKNETIYVNCTGPYILYINTCYMSLNEGENATGVLLLQEERVTISTFTMQTSDKVCRGLHNIVYLKSKKQISLHLKSSQLFIMKEVTVGFTYMLGTERQCFDEIR